MIKVNGQMAKESPEGGSDSRSQLKDFLLSLVADFNCFDSSFPGVKDDIIIPLCRMKVSTDEDMNLCINDARLPVLDAGLAGRMLWFGAMHGDVYLAFTKFKDEPLYFSLLSSVNPEEIPAVYATFDGRSYDERMAQVGDRPGVGGTVLPDVLSDEVAKVALMYKDKVYQEFNGICQDGMKEFYRELGYNRLDELVNNLSFHVITDPESVEKSDLYNLILFFSDKEVNECKERTIASVTEFYQMLFEEGEFRSKDVAESEISFARDLIERSFSREKLLLGKLDFQLENLGLSHGEIRAEDIARVAVWAERAAEYKPYHGAVLENWVKSACMYSGVRRDSVVEAREMLGGKVTTEQTRTRVKPAIVQKAVKQFKIGQ